MDGHSFSHALVRAPAASCVEGLRAHDTGIPDLQRFRVDHASYLGTLRATGAEVTLLPSAEAFPDSVFVEDVALCLPTCALVLMPGAESRIGERDLIIDPLRAHFEDVVDLADGLPAAASIEGGDILTMPDMIFIGRSARTNADGIKTLGTALTARGYAWRAVETPRDVLHLKTDCALLDAETVLATPRLAATGCFASYRVLLTPEGEEAAANCVRFNSIVIAPDGFPRTHDLLADAGYAVVAVSNAQAAKLDGGMSCLSLRFTPHRP
ncbi:MAG: arginine deiminase family protein [Pseudomonadota bacterium]